LTPRVCSPRQRTLLARQKQHCSSLQSSSLDSKREGSNSFPLFYCGQAVGRRATQDSPANSWGTQDCVAPHRMAFVFAGIYLGL
jgi:hypothetical protein